MITFTYPLNSPPDLQLAARLRQAGDFTVERPWGATRIHRGKTLDIVNIEDHRTLESQWIAKTPEAELWLMLNASPTTE